MTDEEFDAWCEYYRRWPFDDYHRYHRPAALVGQMSAGMKDIDPLLQFLQPDDTPQRKPRSAVDETIWKLAGWRG